MWIPILVLAVVGCVVAWYFSKKREQALEEAWELRFPKLNRYAEDDFRGQTIVDFKEMLLARENSWSAREYGTSERRVLPFYAHEGVWTRPAP